MLRGYETASWSPVCAVPESDEVADAVPACGDSAEYEEDGAVLLAVTGSERAGRKVQQAGKPTETLNREVTEILIKTVNSKHIFSKIDTDSRDSHNEFLRDDMHPMMAQELIRRISRGSPFHSLRLSRRRSAGSRN